ncbi:hypothetical protein TVAG_483410 [Trichomonas vaginalis G3]|uniref:Uncharacterized protein n=1 Tax=Trichomonas vaginalis (strain ATCC PRA-98 / G3) TaxID=412133 RepID=A2ETB3_TRIV3|nr:hypothetical protein TVAGG3_0620380 [Trichomonas vaginalis G3]EAY04103.1 hypothetical protein TVAG_483410 [Trichomonas vaginalis G3]KAI5503854.1 hypothetical protein TVAGG3_0620380 [Trichomonas vaginalis G3]|eukprot:XP_001316326.1 hypothetical protein [Trichomonas vaginalis G3]
MIHILSTGTLPFHSNSTLFYDTRINSPFAECNASTIESVLVDVGEQASYQIGGSSSKCFAVQTVFIFGEGLKLAASFYENGAYGTAVESSSFAGVSSNSEIKTVNSEASLAPSKPTVVKLTNKKSTETTVVFVGALPSLTFESGDKFNMYYSSFSKLSFQTSYKEVSESNKVYDIIYGFVPINVGGKMDLKWSGLSKNGIIALSTSNDNESTTSEESSGEKSFSSSVVVTNKQNPGAEQKDGDYTIKISSKISYKISDRPKYVPQVFGSISNKNQIFNFWTLTGPIEIPIWGFIAAAALIVFILILIICLCICCCCCKKKKSKKSSSSYSSSSFYSSSSS